MLMPAPIRIVIATDNCICREALAHLLGTEPDLRVISTGDESDALRLVRADQPDLLLIDPSSPRLASVKMLQSLGPASNTPRVIVIAARMKKEQLLAALRLGVHGIVPRQSSSDVLLRSIRSVMAGQYWLQGGSVGTLVEAMCKAGTTDGERRTRRRLTRRELDIVAAVTKGETNREIAADLSLSEETIKRHLSNIFDKLGVFCRVELAVFAIHHGLVKDRETIT
jgi:DNA-binding NarL/FixJ family response regulator